MNFTSEEFKNEATFWLCVVKLKELVRAGIITEDDCEKICLRLLEKVPTILGDLFYRQNIKRLE